MKKTIGPKFRRALHFDFHTPPGIPNLLSNFDAEFFAEQLADAHVEYINFAARCNMGFSYYNTKVGKKYPGLGDRDILKEILDACHKRNIGVTAYINIGLDHDLAADHLDWLKVMRDGKIYADNKNSNFFRTMCYNSGYRAHLLEEIREIAAYDIDGVFCDCVEKRECYCPRCIADMTARGYDPHDHQAVMDYQYMLRDEFCHEIRAAADKPDLKFYFNGLPRSFELITHAEIECLPGGGSWGYDYFDSIAAYTRPLYEDRLYMSGRFQDEWGDFGGIKPVAAMQNDLYDAMMNSFGLSFGDHMHPVDGFEKEVAARVKTVFEEKMQYEPYTDDSENIVEAAILIPNIEYKSTLCTKGAIRILKELKVLFNIYTQDGDFSSAKLLFICEDVGINDTLKQKLQDFEKCGGKIIFAGSALELGKAAGLLDYVDLIGDDPADNAYFTTPANDMRWAMYAPCKLIKNIDGVEKAKYISNIFNFIWDGRQSYFYRPQGEETDYSAVVTKGNTACICFDLFKAYSDMFLAEHKLLVKELIDVLLPDRLIQVSGMPQSAVVSLTQNPTALVLHVKSTYPEIKMGRGIIEDHTYMKSATVSVSGCYQVKSLPDLKEVACRTEDGRTVFETGNILGYKAFLLC
ncbi:MAG: hypothetical protein E7487_00525 [Ruminococcaceae bacterium]|nr:hypothetical protein [Oscillospiraceae bacterium]